MSVIATEKNVLSNLLVKDLWSEHGFTRDTVTYNGAAKSFLVGDLVASDGTVPAAAANIYGIVMQAVDAPATTNTVLLVLRKGPAQVKSGGINLGALTLPNVKTQLESMNIQVLTSV